MAKTEPTDRAIFAVFQ